MTEPLLPREMRWDGAANADPIANLHAAMETPFLEPSVILLSEWQYARYVLQVETVWPTYRQRQTALALFRHETKRWDLGRRDCPSADEVIARVRALEGT